MTLAPEVFDLHAVTHPNAAVRQAGFALDHPYLEQCWAPIIGPSSVLLLRRCPWLWRDGTPVQVAAVDLGAMLGLGHGTARNSPLARTVERVVRFHFAATPAAGELAVYTEVPPVSARQLTRLPAWCQRQHEQLLGAHLDQLARPARRAAQPPPADATAHARMASRLHGLTAQPRSAPSLSR